MGNEKEGLSRKDYARAWGKASEMSSLWYGMARRLGQKWFSPDQRSSMGCRYKTSGRGI